MKNKPVVLPEIACNYLFDVATVTRDRLLDLIRLHYGGFGSNKTVVGLLLTINELKGFPIIGLEDIQPDRCHTWFIRTYNTKADMWADPLCQQISSEWMGLFSVNGKRQDLGLFWVGTRPVPAAVAKKVKEIGAHSNF